ncbi:AmmeMemoRadiSam system radical SAM enzyme [bacterium]|nr:AmmeMemoRadiSam system radical SAM enzyme [bacterium]
MKEALLYKKNEDTSVDCELCNHFCHILENKAGICGVRRNIKAKLYSLNYNRLISQGVDPIERKPLFHFLPGSLTYSIAAMGCNLSCLNCQNWQISQLNEVEKLDGEFPGELIKASDIVQRAQKENCQSISYTYTEPTIFLETALPIMKLAHQKGLKNVWVSNGYMSQKCLDLILPYLDAVNIDLKFFLESKYKKFTKASLKPILDNLIYLKEKNVSMEITTLLIPGETNVEQQLEYMAKFIYKKLGSDTPWHISKFSAEISYKLLSNRETSMKEMEKAYQIGKKIGLKYVYLGNIAADDRENTYCPKCETLNIERQGYIITRSDKQGLCRNCKENLNIVI